MARAKLYVHHSQRAPSVTAEDSRGMPLDIECWRITAMAMVGKKQRVLRQSLIDTGSPLTLFPVDSWRDLEDEIEWLSILGQGRESNWLTNPRGLTGGEVRCRLGRIWMEVVELMNPRVSFSPIQVIAQFCLMETAEDRIVAGLYGGIMQDRRLVVEPDQQNAWLEEM